jgi:hypothetical protein
MQDFAPIVPSFAVSYALGYVMEDAKKLVFISQ